RRDCRVTGVQTCALPISSIRIRVDAAGEDTALAGIQRLVTEAQQSRSRSQVLADQAAALLFYVAAAAAVVTAIVWTTVGDGDEEIGRASCREAAVAGGAA